jgi:hypothetical protein
MDGRHRVGRVAPGVDRLAAQLMAEDAAVGVDDLRRRLARHEVRRAKGAVGAREGRDVGDGQLRPT